MIINFWDKNLNLSEKLPPLFHNLCLQVDLFPCSKKINENVNKLTIDIFYSTCKLVSIFSNSGTTGGAGSTFNNSIVCFDRNQCSGSGPFLSSADSKSGF